MGRLSMEFKVGVFVVTALCLLVGLVVKAGDFYLRPGYTVRLIFESISGVEAGSPVRLAGVSVGEVKNIRVVRAQSGETQVEINVFITQGVYIEEDAKVRVASLGLLGEKYIEILPGSSGSKTLSDGGILMGESPSNIGELMNSGGRLLQKLEFAMDNVNQVVADPEFKSSVKGTFTNAERMGKNLSETSEDLKDAAKSARIVLGRLRDGEGTIGKLLKDDKIAKDLELFVADIKAHPWKLLKRN